MKSTKKVALLVSAIVVVVVVIAVVSINLVNKSVEKQLVTKLDDQLKNSEYADNLTYTDLKVKAHKGSFVVTDIKFVDENFMVTIDSAVVKIPINEVFSLAKDSMNTELTDITVEMSGIKVADIAKTVSFGQENLNANFKGHINTKIFDSQYNSENIDADIWLEQTSFNTKGLKCISPIGNMDVQNFAFNVVANLKPSVFEGNSSNAEYSMLQSLDTIAFSIENYSFEAEQEFRDSVGMFASNLGEDTFIKNQENWKIMKCSSNITVTDNQIIVNNLDLVTNWINMNTKASVSIEPEFTNFTPLNMNIIIEEYSNELRPLFESLAGYITEDEIPENSFSLNFVQSDMDSFPKVSIK